MKNACIHTLLNIVVHSLTITLNSLHMKLTLFDNYVGGYVARTLLKRHEKKDGDVECQYIQCLGQRRRRR